MRPLRALAALLFLIAGVVLGALNPESTSVDLGMLRIEAGLGLIGGLAITFSVVLPLRRELRQNRKAGIGLNESGAQQSVLSSLPEP
jgi:lipopolysaccharide assembly protein A